MPSRCRRLSEFFTTIDDHVSQLTAGSRVLRDRYQVEQQSDVQNEPSRLTPEDKCNAHPPVSDKTDALPTKETSAYSPKPYRSIMMIDADILCHQHGSELPAESQYLDLCVATRRDARMGLWACV